MGLLMPGLHLLNILAEIASVPGTPSSNVVMIYLIFRLIRA